MAPNDGSKYVDFVPAIEKMIHILDYLEVAENGVSLTGISTDLKISKSSVYRILSTLSHFGYLTQNPGDGSFSLGPRILTLARAVSRKMNVIKVAMPFLEELRNLTGETCKLSITSQNEAIVIAKCESHKELRATTEIGSRFPLHAGAAGKVLLSHLSENEIDRYLRSKPERYTPTTITDPERLREEIVSIRQKGFAEDMEERFEGIRAIACPIYNHEGKVVVAISIPYIATRRNNQIRDDLMVHLFSYSRKISEALGHR